MIFITAKFKIRPEDADQWPQIAADFTKATRNEPGCLWFDWSRSLADPAEYVLVEAFRDGDAGAAHVQSEHFKKAQQSLPPHLAADTADRQLHHPAGRLVPARRDGRARVGLTAPGSVAHPAADRSSCQTRWGEAGMSMCRTPRCASASTIAFCTAGVEPMVPASPMPLAPSGL